MIELSIALGFSALCAWDVCRRTINAKVDKRAKADFVALSSRIDKSDKLMEELALDWRKKIDQLEREQKQTRDIVNGKLATQHARPLGYNR